MARKLRKAWCHSDSRFTPSVASLVSDFRLLSYTRTVAFKATHYIIPSFPHSLIPSSNFINQIHSHAFH